MFANDSLAMLQRYFAEPDPEVFPRTWRPDPSTPARTGSVDELPQVVGGGTVHWDAKVPRFWDIDFQQRSALGPVEGADVADWPFTYHDLAPYYDEVEQLIGVQGDTATFPDLVHKHAPRTGQYPMPPGPQMRASTAVAAGAAAVGLHPFPFPMAANSVSGYNGQHACNNCGFCSSFGCPVVARPSALVPLRQALRTGRVELKPETMVTKINLSGSRAKSVTWVTMTDQGPATGTETADVVVMAASAIETVRLALLSDFPDRSGKLGRRLMLHAFIDGSAIFLDERMHAYRGRSVTQCVEDAVDPDYPGARAFAKQHGLPYLRGGLMELGGSQDPIAEAQSYQTLLGFVRAAKPFGTEFKQLMRASILRDRLAGCSFIGHDLPYLSHTVTLDAEGQGRVRAAGGPHHLERGQARAGGPAVLDPAAEADDESGRRGRGPGRARHLQQRWPAHRQPHHGRHDDGNRPGHQRDRPLRPGTRPGQRVRGRRVGIRHLGRAQPDEHDHGRGPAQHAQLAGRSSAS